MIPDSTSPSFFAFEADFVASLRCIPMQVRYKLDSCGIKLKLQHWHHFTQEQRSQLVTLPCATESEIAAFRDWLQNLVLNHTGELAQELPVEATPAWLESHEIPLDVQTKATEVGNCLTLQQWRSLTPLQRFALIKLSRPSHENRNFFPALQEFGLTSDAN